MRFFSFFIFIIFLLSSFVFPFSCLGFDDSYIWSSSSVLTSSNISSDTTSNTSLDLDCASAILIEQSSGQVLYEHNVHEKLRPASVTKVMSILLIMEAISNQQISLSDSVPCSESAASMGGSQIWLDPRETLSVDEMLKAICVNSANDYDVQLLHEFFLSSNLK